MSLINEALKKAQKQRTGDSPSLTAMPTVGGESAERIARRGKSSSGPNLLLLGGGAGVLALIVVGLGAFVYLRRESAPAIVPAAPVAAAPSPAAPTLQPAPAVTPVASAAVNPPPSPVSTPVVPSPATTVAAAPSLPVSRPVESAPPVFTVPHTAAAAPVATVTPPKPEPGSPAAVATAPAAVSEPPPAVAPAPTGPARMDARALTYINTIRVAGIRASANDSKVLMNDRVYRIGDMVEYEMGLKLVGITGNSLTFENDAGVRYTRNF